jgi:hypothetical protein
MYLAMGHTAQTTALDIEVQAGSILADLGDWDFISDAGKTQVRSLCAIYQAATAADLVTSPLNPDLRELFESRLSDLRLLKNTIRQQISEAQDCEWLRMALASSEVNTTRSITGFMVGVGHSSAPN